MKMVFSTKMKSTGQITNLAPPKIIVNSNNPAFGYSMLSKIVQSKDCITCKNIK